MPNKPRQRLAQSLAPAVMFPTPKTNQERLANELFANTVKMHNYGPDDPIPWESFATSPEESGVNPGPPAGLGWGVVPQAAAAQPVGLMKRTGNAIDDAMLKLMMLGFDPAEFSPQRKKR